MFVEAAQLSQRNWGLFRNADNSAKVLRHIDKGYMTQKFAVDWIHSPRGEIDPDKIVENKGLR